MLRIEKGSKADGRRIEGFVMKPWRRKETWQEINLALQIGCALYSSEVAKMHVKQADVCVDKKLSWKELKRSFRNYAATLDVHYEPPNRCLSVQLFRYTGTKVGVDNAKL